MVRSAAATVPIIRHLIDTQELSLSILAETGVNRVSILLLHARRAAAAVLGEDFSVLADGEEVGVLENTPNIIRDAPVGRAENGRGVKGQ